jgi:antitoxin (DNA-binding transcriptional repressor) of toxin-antitoxin stability system
VNITEAKAHLGRYVAALKPGETMLICKRGQPVAEIRSLKRRKPRIGFAKGEFTVPPSFFEPLPDDMLAYFNGEGPDCEGGDFSK